MGIELISSRKMVPPSAISNKPGLFSAPVKLPFIVPNRILSIKASGMAAQFCAMKGFSARLLALCSDWANNSFPVPVSPYIKTGELPLAIFFG